MRPEAPTEAINQLALSWARDPGVELARCGVAFFRACPEATDEGIVLQHWEGPGADPVVTEFGAQTLCRRSIAGDSQALNALVLALVRPDRASDSTIALAMLPVPMLDALLPAIEALSAEAGQLLGAVLLTRLERAKPTAPAAPPPEPSPVDEHRRLIGSLLDHDAREVFDKLEALLDTAPQLGEALLLEMASRKMDLRGAISLLRDRVERDDLKSWIQTAVTDELERLVYLAMI